MVFTCEGHRKSGQIKITHYVSPHEFWFKYVDDDNDSAENEIQQRIERLANVSQNQYNYSPLAGEIVIVHYCFGAANKFIRARVDVELKYSGGSVFVLWAIDEGFPIESNKKWIMKLTSADLQNETSRVYKATLNDVVPATVQFNFLEGKAEMVKTNCWSEKAIDEFEKISNAESLIFHYDCHAAKQHLYGSIEVITYTGVSVKMNEVLKKLDEAIDATSFEKEYQTLVRKDYWIQQQVNYKIKVNFTGGLAPQSAAKAIKPQNIKDINTVDKIDEWDKRNQRSLSTQNTDSESLALKVQDCNLNEVPHSKRYSYHRSKLNASQSTIVTSRTENRSSASPASTYDFDNSVYSTTIKSSHSENIEMVTLRSHFKKALEEEKVFTTGQRERVLCHFNAGIPPPLCIKSIAEAKFKQEIHDKLPSMGKTDIYRIQQFAWNHIMRGHSLIVINGNQTGKTWSYLPAICSLLLEADTDETIVDSEGPVMIVICLDSSSVDSVAKNCRNLLPKTISCETYIQNEMKEIQLKMLNGMHLLVVTIPSLLRLMNNPLRCFDKKRITTIVFDEIDSMYDRFGQKSVDTVYKEFCLNTKMQVIVTSKTWHRTLNKFCRKDDMLLCIGAYIEAAMYAKVEITLHYPITGDHYGHFFREFKEGNYIKEPTIIICSKSEEVLKISRIFEGAGYAATFCHDRTDSSAINDIKSKINRNLTDQLGVLVCTDDVLGDLDMRHAQHIIHFSLPDYWTQFTQRFLASFNYYENFVEDRHITGRPTSVVYVDRRSIDTMPRLIEFMKVRCSAEVPEKILHVAEHKRIEREEKRLTKYKPFCENVLLLGVCQNQYSCKSRHVLTKYDRPRECNPRNGDIKFHVDVQNIHSPTHFTVRLLEHRSLQRKEWQKMPHAEDYACFQLKFNDYFNDEANRVEFYPDKVGELCVIEDEETKFQRCEIISIDFDERKKQTTLTLLMIDTNVTTDSRNSPLFVLPEGFRNFPPQAVDVRIAGVVPLDLSTTWDKSSKDIVKQWFKDTENCEIQGKIELTLMNCIWVESIELIDKLSAINAKVLNRNIKTRIIKNELGVENGNSLRLLREMARKAGILDTEPYEPQKHLLPVVKTQERGRRGKMVSHSSSESVNSSTSFSRTIPSNNSNGCVASQKVKSPNDKKSSSAVVERWATLFPDTFNEVDIGEFYTPDRICVLLARTYQSFKELGKKIDGFTANSDNLKPLVKVEVGELCLILMNKDYRRAKIIKVDETTVNVFLVDFGTKELDVPLSNLIQIPVKFIKYLPFQAILCKMVGIRPSNDSKEFSDRSCDDIYETLVKHKTLFVRPTGPHSVTNDIIKCNSYDVVFVDQKSEQNINQLVVNEKLADIDSATKQFIDLTVDYKSLQLYGADEESWDSDDMNMNGNIYDAGSYFDGFEEKKEKSRFEFLNGDVDVDVQFTEDDIKDLMGLPEHAKLLTTDNRPMFPTEEFKVFKKLPPAKPKAITGTAADSTVENLVNNQLVHPAKMPNIVWKQTPDMIILAISAPDVNNYFLKVGPRYVHFSFIKSGERFENILHLFGCVEVTCTTHEVRGLDIIVRLKKTLATIHWPRLVQSPDKNRFIKYKIDECEVSDEYSGDDQACTNKNYSTNNSSDDEGDDVNISDIEL